MLPRSRPLRRQQVQEVCSHYRLRPLLDAKDNDSLMTFDPCTLHMHC